MDQYIYLKPFSPLATLNTTTTMTTTTASKILRHTNAFIFAALTQTETRHQILSLLRHKNPPNDQTTLKSLDLALEALETAISSEKNSAIQSSFLQQAEKLLLSHPLIPFSSFLLCLIYGLCHLPSYSAVSLLNIFDSDPSFARSEIAPLLFQELFMVHLLPVLHWFEEQRANILSSLKLNIEHQSMEFSVCDEYSVVFPCTKSLSKMSGGQTTELKELEETYEVVLDENCRIFAKYFKEIVEKEDEDTIIYPPTVRVDTNRNYAKEDDDQSIKTEELLLENGRYNPIWAEEERSTESSSSNSTNGVSTRNQVKFKPFYYPQRVSFKTISNQKFFVTKSTSSSSSNSNPDSEQESSPDSDSAKVEAAFLKKHKEPIHIEEEEEESSHYSNISMAKPENPPDVRKVSPPKDFICPITSNLFNDPVTLETGQTYERKAIQEWLDRGYSTCPITRQELQCSHLPKTNYVLKRLIASWQEQNPSFVPNKYDNSQEEQVDEEEEEEVHDPLSTSPNCVISQATIDGAINELRDVITTLCTSQTLKESEMAVLRIEQFWMEGKSNRQVGSIETMLSKPPVINGFVEILFNSLDPRVLRATIFLLSEMGLKDKGVIQTLTQVESDVDCIMALFKKGLFEAIVLIYLIGDSLTSLIDMEMVDCILKVVKKKEEDLLTMCLKPKTASVLLLGRIFRSTEERMKKILSSIASSIISEDKLTESIVDSLESDKPEERISAVEILLRCIEQDGKFRNFIADKAELTPVLESFMKASEIERFDIVRFLSELIKLNRRTFNEQVLHIIKDEGSYSTMHTLLVYLQNCPPQQCPVVAGLLLQLDLLVEPRKMSIYREEAIDSLISCLKNSEFQALQLSAAETIVSLQGRFSNSGTSLARAFLLKRAGLEKSYKKIMHMSELSNLSVESEETMKEEEKAANEWERKMAFVLVSHEFGLLFEALAEGLKSKNGVLSSACFLSATWLTHMLRILPDTGIRGAARVCFLKHFVSVLKSSKDIEDKALSLLALNSLIHDPEGLKDVNPYMKEITKALRELKKSSPLAFEMLKVLSEVYESSSDLWNHKELFQVDCSENGEVLSIVYFIDKIFSGHSDGTIKVWTGRGSVLHLLQEALEHSKAVTSLSVLKSGEKLYSGSLDRTIKVWSIGNSSIHCVHVYDMKVQVHSLVVSNNFSCFIPQGSGIRINLWNGESKVLNSSKHVKCLALVNGKLYCGCHDSSIQEIDLATGTIGVIQTGTRKLLGKSNPVQAIQIHSGLIYSACSSLDAVTVKIWNVENYGLVGSLPTLLDVRAMAISSELVYLGGKGETIEIWDKEKQNRIEILQTGTNSKVNCMTLDDNEELFLIGTSNGRIQAWGLS